ncbi:unnamed protein product [Protopolystoma xenopodis]|uniref:Uncharacterized protein n=1 Tax=Protopolystoma xenopodis TaxID=117903 RepID=A0A3S5BS53_9PLAT|nr:unnamed protein product [Protopolystoma xenopodis]
MYIPLGSRYGIKGSDEAKRPTPECNCNLVKRPKWCQKCRTRHPVWPGRVEPTPETGSAGDCQNWRFHIAQTSLDFPLVFPLCDGCCFIK